MGVLLKKSHGLYHLRGITKLALVGLIISLAAASINTIWAIYLDSILHSEVYVGLISAFFTIVAFVSYFLFIPLIERSDKTKLFSISLIAFIFFNVLFAITTNIYLLLIIATGMIIFQTLRITSYGIIIKDSSKKGKLSNNLGVIYTFINSAYLIGPLLAAYIVAHYNMNAVFLLGATFFFLGLIVFQFAGAKGKKGTKVAHKDAIKNFTEFFKDKDRTLIYILRSGITLWWILIYLFIPLMIVRSNLGNEWIGYFLFAVALPLIIFEYVFAKQASKKGFKKMFKLAYLIVAIIAFICFFTSNIYLTLGLLSLGSIGMAMLEPTTEAYFFGILKGKESYRFYGPFNTSLDFGGLVAKLSGSLLLIFLPFKFIFLLFAFLMFLLFLTAFKTKKL